jgi:hypothetical protein
MLGAKLVTAVHPETGEEIQRWTKPKHKTVALHFVNEAARRKFAKGELSEKDAFSKVPVYEGMDNRTFKKTQNNLRYGEKLSSAAWKKEAANIRAVVR